MPLKIIRNDITKMNVDAIVNPATRCVLKGLQDLEMISWVGVMRAHIIKMNKHKNSDLKSVKTECNPELLVSFEAEYDRLIAEGRVALSLMKEGSFGYSGLNAMLNRLTDYKDCYLLFIRNYKVPFTNNLAERPPPRKNQRKGICKRFF
ncbi:MAG: hypothetical protein FWC20_08965 [Oscillospiraceae bacterium]|nr:hypothetical protein [Oscillospiraceae bacterium]MCL2279519.1 hypothetical protein [Oscillospiraceae bacterium]